MKAKKLLKSVLHTIERFLFSLRKCIITFVALKEHGIDKDGCTDQNAFLVHGSIIGKVDFKGMSLSKDFCGSTLGFFDNFPNVLRTVGIRLGGRENMKGYLATTTSTTGIALGTTIDQDPTTTGWLMNLVNPIAIVIPNRKTGDTEPTIFSDRS